MEIKNSYILLYNYKDNPKKHKQQKNIDSIKKRTIFLSTEEDDPIKDYFSKCFYDIKKTEELPNFYAKYECQLKKDDNCSVVIISKRIIADYYIDIIISGKKKEQIIHKMELIHSSILESNMEKEYTFIISYDSVSEYYCNKMSVTLNEIERKLRKLLYLIYTARYRDEYIDNTFVDNLLSSSSKQQIISKLNKQSNSKEKVPLIQRFFEEFEYQHYMYLLFFQKWTDEDKKSKERFFAQIQNEQGFNKKTICQEIENFLPQSDWTRFYSGKVKNSDMAEALLLSIKKQRNKVAHYKTITKKDYMEFLDSAHKLLIIIDDAIKETTTKEFLEQFKKRNAEYISKILNDIIGVFGDFFDMYY